MTTFPSSSREIDGKGRTVRDLAAGSTGTSLMSDNNETRPGQASRHAEQESMP